MPAELEAATGAGANDDSLSLWIDGTLQSTLSLTPMMMFAGNRCEVPDGTWQSVLLDYVQAGDPETNPPTFFTKTLTWSASPTQTITVQARDTESGLYTATAVYSISTNGGATWSGPFNASVSGQLGSRITQTITATNAGPFLNGANNRIRFEIKDIAGNTGQMIYTVRYDGQAPNAVASDNQDYGNPSWTVSTTASDGESGVERVRLYYRYGTGGSWIQYGSDITTTSYEWTFNPPSGTGLYQFCARARDLVGNWEAECSAAEEGTTYSTATPLITLASITVSPYAYATGSKVYYNNNGSNTGAFTVTAQVTDTGGGLKYMRFPTTTSAGTFSETVTSNGLYGWKYVFTPTATFSETAYITVGNPTNHWQGTPLNVIRDGVGPSVQVTVPSKIVSGTLPVSWSASDALSGPTNVYTVSVMTDTGALQLWLGSTAATSANFTPTFGHAYTFVVAATDHVGNTGQSTVATDAIQVTKYYYIGSSRVAMRRGTPTGSEVTYLHTDHLGTVSVATSSNGQFIARTLNLPYGGVRWSSGTMPTDYAFTGEKLDISTGLHFFKSRYYSSYAGRFIKPDSVVPDPRKPRDLNRYAYAANNPLSFIDPDGHQIRPPDSCGVICYTGTTGPYVEGTPPIGTWPPPPPPPPPPAAPTAYWTSAEYRQKEIGVILQYAYPAETYLTGETVPLNVEAPVGLVIIQGDYSHAWEHAVSSGQVTEYNQASGSIGLGPHLANVIGADLRVGATHAQGVTELSLTANGELGPLEGYLGLPPQGGIQLNLPGGSALRGSFKLQSARDAFFLTAQEYLDSVGGLDAFGKRYAPGATYTDMALVYGAWSRGRWAAGLENARLVLRLAQAETGGWPPYQEVP